MLLLKKNVCAAVTIGKGRSEGALNPDVEWYLTQEIVLPVSRLIELVGKDFRR